MHLTQRICGLCPVSHALAASKAIENSKNFKAVGQARLLRNLIQGGNYVSDHILHFYHLTLLDYFKGPEKALWQTGYDTDMRFSKKASKALFENYVKALEMRRKAHEMVSLFAGKIPHVMSIMPGGVTKTPTSSEITEYKSLLNEVKAFIDNQYFEDVQKIASVYKDYYHVGKGYGNFLTFGVFEVDGSDPTKMLYRGGRYEDSDGKYKTVDTNKITEDITHTWYEGVGAQSIKNGSSKPQINKENSYSWIKAPRYLDKPYEAGPLARAYKPYEAGPLARAWINGDYRKGISVMDRHVARMLESKKIAHALSIWINELKADTQEYDPNLHMKNATGEGIGVTEAPRGALLHYISYKNNLIQNYQIITPTCWNASPKDENGVHGPLEAALVGVQIQDSNNPIELMRIIHSFDPCTACAVHVIQPEQKVERRFVASVPGL